MIKKICGFLMGILILVVAVVAVVLIVPPMMGCKNMAVLSGSMEPGIPVGSVVVARPLAGEGVQIGDVITYQLDASTMVTHRIVELDLENRQVITKGDANDTVDAAPVSMQSIVGLMWFHIPFLGYVSVYLRTPLGVIGLCAVAALLVFLNIIPSVIGKNK